MGVGGDHVESCLSVSRLLKAFIYLGQAYRNVNDST